MKILTDMFNNINIRTSCCIRSIFAVFITVLLVRNILTVGMRDISLSNATDEAEQ